jgi:hypothetical protein
MPGSPSRREQIANMRIQLNNRRRLRGIKTPAAIFFHISVAEFSQRILTQKLRGFR